MLSCCGPVKYETGLHSKKKKLGYYLCVCKGDVCRGRSGLNQIIRESMLHVEEQAQYMEAVL